MGERYGERDGKTAKLAEYARIGEPLGRVHQGFTTGFTLSLRIMWIILYFILSM